MAFDPDAYLAEKAGTATAVAPSAGTSSFDPDLYLKQKEAGPFDQVREDLATSARMEEDRTKGLDPVLGEFVRRNARPGVPLDPREMLPAGVRARLSVESDPNKQAELLSKQPGILQARNVNGRVIATINGPDGKERDVLLHPAGVDIAGNTVPIAKVGAATGLALATGGASLPATVTILGGGTAALDALSKEASRLESGMDLDPKDLAKSAAIEGGVNVALPVAGSALKGGANFLLRRGAGALERNAAEAALRQGIPLTPAQATGSEVLARSASLPGTGGKALAQAQKDAIEAATDRQLGLSGPNAVPSESEVAKKIQPVIAANSEAAQGGATALKNDAAAAAEKGIVKTLDQGIATTKLSPSEAGAAVRGKIETLRDAFQKQAQENYAAAYQIAEKENTRIPTEPIRKLAEDIAAKDPQNALPKLIPEIDRIFKLSAQLETPTAQTVNQEAASMTLPQAVELRAVINDKIARGEAVGDIPGRYLKKLAGAFTDAIDQGVKAGSPELQLAYDEAKKHYAAGIGKFTPADIAKLFSDPESGRYLGDSEIIPSIFRGRGNLDALQMYKQVLGENSPEYKLLLRQGVNNLMDESGTTGGLLNADKFLSRLQGLSKEMQDEVLGPSAKAIAANARISSAARGVKIDPVDLENALKAAPGDAPKLFEKAVERQATVDREFNNRIMAGIRDGTFGDKTVAANPDTFVTRFLQNASAGDVKQALNYLGNQTREMLRSRTLANILSDVRAKPQVGQATTGESIAINSDKLMREYLTDANRAKFESVLGKDGVQFLEDLATINEAMAKEALQAQGSPLTPANRAAYLAGDLLPGERGLVRSGVRALTVIPEFALGNAQRSAAVRQFLTTGELPKFSPLVRAGVLATPEAVTERRRALQQKPPGEPKREPERKGLLPKILTGVPDQN